METDYTVPEDAHVFIGGGLHDERVAFWIGKNGAGFGAIDRDPETYVRVSAALASGDATRISEALKLHGGVDEYEFEPGSYDYRAETLTIEAHSSF